MVFLANGVVLPPENQANHTPNGTVIRGDPNRINGETQFHLYASLADPLSHRVLLFRSLNHLHSSISLSIANPYQNTANGWHFSANLDFPGCEEDTVNGCKYLHEIYRKHDPNFTGEVSLPVLWDKNTNSIASNDSLDILGILNARYHSEEAQLIKAIDENVNKAVYKAGYARDQVTYEMEVKNVFETLEMLEQRLSNSRYLFGDTISLADILLFATLVRFDSVYVVHLKTNLKTISGDYPNLWNYSKDLFQSPGVAETVNFPHIKTHHFVSHAEVNPKQVIPKGGLSNFLGKHDRTRFQSEAGETKKEKVAGEFVRGVSGFRSFITADGSSGFKAEPDRYHIYIANNCPWCHRVRLAWSLKGLESVISMTEVHYRREDTNGWWQFPPGTTDPLTGIRFPKELYGRFGSAEKSVPILWDKKTETIVSNESSDIIRMFDQAFTAPTFPTAEFQTLIDEYDTWIYPDVANGAYRTGFANSQLAYEMAFDVFFNALDRLEVVLSNRKFLCGEKITEADIKLFPPLFRFDHCYYTRFNLNKKTIRHGYPNIHRYLLDMWRNPAVRRASNMDHIKKGYFGRTGTGLVPLGPAWTFDNEIVLKN